MLQLFGVLEIHLDGSTHIIVFVVDRQFDFILAVSDFVVLLGGFGVEAHVDFECAGKAAEEGAQLILR